MSHFKERKEKLCLNCGAAVHGRYCHVCGQENIEPKESFWHLITHFVYDIIHFDGKFFGTLKYLLFKPGFLSHEHLLGRRQRYLHPIRLYVFTSAFFFLIFFSFYQKHDLAKKPELTINNRTEREIDLMPADSFAVFTANINKNDKKDSVPMTREEFAKFKDSTFKKAIKRISIFRNNYHDRKEYDSLIKTGALKHGWLKRQMVYRDIKLFETFKENPEGFKTHMIEKFLHLFPQMLFISLPLFALILKLLYIRRKQFFFANHVVFSIHLYCAFFIIILLGLWTNSLWKLAYHANLSDGFVSLFVILGFFYWYKALRNFYEQRRIKTILKYILLMFTSFIMLAFLLVLFLLFTAISI